MALIWPIETITPIWTGDNDKKTRYLRATSFLGGLRFWTEALLRSLGENVCSTTGENTCTHDPENEEDTCSACKIFGCTGLSRSFTLKVTEDTNLKDAAIGHVKLDEYTYTNRKKHENGKIVEVEKKKIPQWYLKEPGRNGVFNLAFSPLRPPLSSTADRLPFETPLDGRLALATHLLLHWGMLGAKDQYGYGLVRVTEPNVFKEFWQEALQAIPPATAPVASDWPSLRDFFFFQGKIKDEQELPQRTSFRQYPRDIPFEIRHVVRNGLRDPEDNNKDKKIRHFFCGAIEGNTRLATKFNMGLDLDRSTIHGWGHFPSAGTWALNRDRCLNLLKNKLSVYCHPVCWKEFDSTRDTCGSSKQWGAFLHELANTPWR